LTASIELDALPCPVIVTDLCGQIIFINEFALNDFYIGKKAQVNRIEELFPPAANILLQTHLWPMLRKEGLVREFYLKIKRESNTPLPVLLNIQEGSFEQQACYRWVILPAEQRANFEQELVKTKNQLQTFAKDAESSRYFLRTVLDGAKDIAILAVSETGYIRFANTGAEVLLTQPLARLMDSNVLSYFTDDIISAYFTKTKTREQNSVQINLPDNFISEMYETLICRSSGERIDVQLQIRQLDQTLLVDDIKYIVLLTDISQRKQYEKLQNGFIANISHELRTPLTAILGSLHLLNSGKLGDIPQKAQKLIDITVNNANRLRHLITDVLDFSKLKTTKMSIELQSVQLQPMLEDAVTEHRYYLADKKIQLALKPLSQPISITVDPQRFMQVMSNLLSNAIKFSAPDSQVQVVTIIENSFITIAIEDQGPGVKPEFLPYLFTQFSQQDSSTNRQFEGSGLGLAICKSLIEAMDGDIGYKARPGGGAIFWFRVKRSLA
jgi:signal transduction histidine kinase